MAKMKLDQLKQATKMALNGVHRSSGSVRRSKQFNPSNIKRRPSVEIASDYVEMDFRAVMDAEQMEQMTKRQRKHFAKERQRRERRHHPLRNAIVTVCALVLVAGVCGYMWWDTSNTPVDVNDLQSRRFNVDKGSSTSDVAKALQERGFIRNSLAFRIYMRLHGGVIQAGTHMISPSYTLGEVVKTLAKADTNEVSVTIPPGKSLRELRTVFAKYGYGEEEIDAAFSKAYDNPILANRPDGATLEGYLYPDTYRIYAGDDLSEVINKALAEFNEQATKNDLAAKFANHGLTMYQGVTMASIVNLEVPDYDDQRKVAGVFYNRLQRDISLGSDPTFKYAFAEGLCDTNTSKCNSVYNTRIYKGLPPSPIASPSLSALKAVADPEIGTALYFVSGDDGKTYFSDTLDQHNQAIATHCTKLCQ